MLAGRAAGAGGGARPLMSAVTPMLRRVGSQVKMSTRSLIFARVLRVLRAGAGGGARQLVTAATPVPGGLGSQVKMITRLSTLARALRVLRAGADGGGRAGWCRP